MHKFVSFNHEILSATDIKINAISSASLYGKGIFTTVAIYNSKPFLWEKHWRRLVDNAEKLNIGLSEFTEKNVRKSLSQIIEKNKVKNGRCRITFFDESSSQIWETSNQDKTSFLIQTADFRNAKKKLGVGVSSYTINSKSPIIGIKSNNYLESLLALEKGQEKGFDEMIICNEKGNIVSFCMANIFWLEYGDQTLYTPSLKTGCLPGTTRELIMENLEVEEVETKIEDLFLYSEAIFATSSGIGIKRVTEVNGDEIPYFNHEILTLIENTISKS